MRRCACRPVPWSSRVRARLDQPFALEHGLSASVALLVKDRDAGTSARVALEDALR